MKNPKKISSSQTFFIKYIAPLLWHFSVLTFVVYAYVNFFEDIFQDNISKIVFISICLGGWIIGVFAFKIAFRDVADVVYDHDEYLAFSYKNKEDIKIPLKDVVSISYNRILVPTIKISYFHNNNLKEYFFMPKVLSSNQVPDIYYDLLNRKRPVS